MARTMERQLEAAEKQLVASFQPDVGLSFIQGIDSESGRVEIKNAAAFPLKLQAVHTVVWFEQEEYGLEKEDTNYTDLVISPGKSHEHRYFVKVKQGATTSDYNRFSVVVCSDLSEVSQHWFIITGRGEFSHHAPRTAYSRWTDTERYLRFLGSLIRPNLPSHLTFP
jgi:hypothetical protein